MSLWWKYQLTQYLRQLVPSCEMRPLVRFVQHLGQKVVVYLVAWIPLGVAQCCWGLCATGYYAVTHFCSRTRLAFSQCAFHIFSFLQTSRLRFLFLFFVFLRVTGLLALLFCCWPHAVDFQTQVVHASDAMIFLSDLRPERH